MMFAIFAMFILSKSYLTTINAVSISFICLLAFEILILFIIFLICLLSKSKGTILSHAKTKSVIVFITYSVMIVAFLLLILVSR